MAMIHLPPKGLPRYGIGQAPDPSGTVDLTQAPPMDWWFKPVTATPPPADPTNVSDAARMYSWEQQKSYVWTPPTYQGAWVAQTQTAPTAPQTDQPALTDSSWEGITDIIGDPADFSLSSPIVWIIAGGLALWLLTRK